MSTLTNPATRPGTALSDPLIRAKSLAAVIEAEADRTAEIGEISPVVIDAIRATELFWMNVPAELGGEDISMKKRFEVYEEVASYDGSTGWSFMTLSGFVGYTAVGLGDSAVEVMYGDRDNRCLAAGFAAPTGTAVAVDGGYRVTGSYRFGSGVPHADYFAAGAATDGDPAETFTAFVPRSQVQTLGGWNVFGLKGSGSIDFAVDDVVVPKDFTFDPANYVAHRGGAGGRMDFLSTALVYHSAIAAGIAKHALREVVKVADSGRQRPPAPKILDQQRFAHDFAYREGRLAAARALIIECIENARVKIENNEEMTDVDRARLRLAANTMHTVALETAQWAYTWGGTASFRDGSRLGRCLLDIEVAIQHAHVDHTNIDDLAPTIIGEYR